MNAKLKQAIDEAFPGPSQDPADYAVDMKQFQQSLAYLKQRFIQHYGEEEWERHKNKFTQELLRPDPDIAQKMRGIYQHKPLQRDFGRKGTPGEDLTPYLQKQEEWAAEESLVQKIIGKPLVE